MFYMSAILIERVGFETVFFPMILNFKSEALRETLIVYNCSKYSKPIFE